MVAAKSVHGTGQADLTGELGCVWDLPLGLWRVLATALMPVRFCLATVPGFGFGSRTLEGPSSVDPQLDTTHKASQELP